MKLPAPVRGALVDLDRVLAARSTPEILAVAACGVAVVGFLDYLCGYQISLALFYLGPVSLAAWYAGRKATVATAALASASWVLADAADAHHYSNPAVPVWNTLVRLGFFLVGGLLLAALRERLQFERRLATTDALTGLYGRRTLEERLDHDIEIARRRHGALSLAYIDLDGFKTVNDRWGHAVGDDVLRTFGTVLMTSTRRVDTAARLGGDEFALVLPDTDADGARELVTKVRHDLADAFPGAGPGTTCSIGVVTFREAPASVEAALAAADALMYEVKRRGKNAIEFAER